MNTGETGGGGEQERKRERGLINIFAPLTFFIISSLMSFDRTSSLYAFTTNSALAFLSDIQL